MKSNLLKTMLVGVGLLAGTVGTWAEDSYEEVFSRVSTFGATNIWTDADITEWGGNANLSIDVPAAEDDTDTHHGLWFNPTKPSSAYSANKEFAVDDNAKVKYELDWYVGSSTGRESNYEYIQFGDKIRLSWNSKYCFYLNTDGQSTSDVQVGNKGSNTTYTKPIVIIFNTATKTVESFVFDGLDLTDNVPDIIDGNFNSISFGFVRGGSTSNWAYPNGIENIKVSQCKQEVSTANYTINYKYNGQDVKVVSSSGVVESTVIAESVVYGTDDNNRYLIVDEEAPAMTISSAGNNVLNVQVRKPYTATLNLTTIVGGEETKDSKPFVETDDKICEWSYVYSLYVQKDGKFYIADNTENFGEKGVFEDGETITKTVSYTNVDDDVVFFAEAEGTEAGTDIQYSNGKATAVGAQNYRNRGISAGILPAGKYVFAAVITAKNNRSLVVREQADDNGEAKDAPIFATLNYNTNEAEFSLNAETKLVINGANSGDTKTNQSEDFDYVLIKKVPLAVTIGSTGYATYSSNVPVDFSSVEGLKAYAVTVNADGTTLTRTPVDKAPAGTGLLLEGTAGETYTLPVAVGAEAVTDNDLVGAAEAVTLPEAGATVYYGLKELADGNVGFAKINTGIEGGFTVPAGKAYLAVEASEAKQAFFSLDSETTGIESVESDGTTGGKIYNMMGMPVEKASKGLYIMNGKKVIIK